ncbi:hypothetical protein KQH60_04120 [Mycetohabitans sp. B8]|uniref:hypothetical protein n=1 Tax=Mycetohabitans sp. B8 TaxID=2841845 RepID=UPI001F3341D3|nr:hypothetical protein [Mycetohabitans sp. B8]MCG1041798.1 hypothetical protein [Mycetohabitans sp. B8]
MERAPNAWFKLWTDLRHDLPLFGALGLAAALTLQWCGRPYAIDKLALPVSLLYLAFAAMALACTLQCGGALVFAFMPHGAARRLDAAQHHLERRMSAFSSSAGSLLFGFALGRALFHDTFGALQSSSCAVLAIALAEIGANATRCRREGFARLYPLTLLIVLKL